MNPEKFPSHLRFFQDSPRMGNQFQEDTALRELLKRVMPDQVLREVEPDLNRFGARVVGDVWKMAKEAHRHENEPKLVQYNGWGQRVDDIITCREWKELHDVAAEEGIIAAGYERKYAEFSRLYQYVKLYLFSCSSAVVTCPLAMTDGACRLIEVIKQMKGDEWMHPELEEALRHMTSRDPKDFWTSGQWMTERRGGSDVGYTETIARLDSSSGEPRRYLLTGYKFFTSATTADVAFTLARIEDQNGNLIQGSRGLSLFKINLRNSEGKLNNILVHRLKDKFGTKTLPTAELELIGTPALLIGKPGEGVRNISWLFNVTRIYTAISSAASMRRMIAVARDYAHRRIAFGKPLTQHPLHVASLANLEVLFRGTLHFAMNIALLLGEDECKSNEESKALLRLMTPIVKLYTSFLTMEVMTEGLTLFGGAGYMEDTGLPTMLREAQVNTIWEGTTNVLCLDVLRAITKSPQSMKYYFDVIMKRVEGVSQDLKEVKKEIEATLHKLKGYLSSLKSRDPTAVEAGARDLTFTMAKVYVASLLVEHAKWSGSAVDAQVASRWCRLQPLCDIRELSTTDLKTEQVLGLDLSPEGKPRGCGNYDLNGIPRAKFQCDPLQQEFIQMKRQKETAN